MNRIYKILDEYDERSHDRHMDDHMLEKAFKEGCEHGYNKAMKELEEYHEKSGKSHDSHKGDFDEKIKKLKEKYS